MSEVHKCLDLFAMPAEAMSLPDEERRKVIDATITRVSPPGGFKPGELAHKASISIFEEAMCIAVLGLVLGGPLLLLPTLVLCLFLGGWKACVAWLVVVLFLALHPLPRSKVSAGKQSTFEAWLMRTRFTLALIDLQMPLMDGFECVRRLREWEAEPGTDRPRTCCVCNSANSNDSSVRDEALAAGFDGCVSNPI